MAVRFVPANEYVTAVWKVPSPLPNSTEREPRVGETTAGLSPELATARSSLPSPLKSPTATEIGFTPTLNICAGPKLGVGQPRARAGSLGNRLLNRMAQAITAAWITEVFIVQSLCHWWRHRASDTMSRVTACPSGSSAGPDCPCGHSEPQTFCFHYSCGQCIPFSRPLMASLSSPANESRWPSLFQTRQHRRPRQRLGQNSGGSRTCH